MEDSTPYFLVIHAEAIHLTRSPFTRGRFMRLTFRQQQILPSKYSLIKAGERLGDQNEPGSKAPKPDSRKLDGRPTSSSQLHRFRF